MRLWHQDLIDKLPRQQLLGQHRECCALRGKGWGKKHATVDYVFEYDPSRLVAYHYKIMQEMEQRGYNPNKDWYLHNYRGKNLGLDYGFATDYEYWLDKEIYPEHNKSYLRECVENLAEKECVCRYIEEVI